MDSNNYNVLDFLLFSKKKYIILFSGLKFSPIEQIVTELEKDFNAIVLNYLHLELDNNLDVLNTRVNDLLKKQEKPIQPLFIIGKSFSTDKLKIFPDYHFNISLSKNDILELDPAKRSDLPELYLKSLQTNRINKYINIKKKYDLNEIVNNIFNLIIDDIEKKVYGDKYNKLSYKFYKENSNESNDSIDEPSNEPSKLVFDPKSVSPSEKQKIITENAEKEIQDAIDETEDSISIEKSDDELDEDDIFKDEVRIFGSR
jgi:hypothetical protein